MVPETMFKDKTPSERHDLLEANCDLVQKVTYMKSFEEEELRKRKDALAETSVRITDIEEDIKTYKQKKDEELKPLKEDRKKLIADIKAKGELVDETGYKFVFLKEHKVGIYNEDGDLIEQRRAYPDEMSPTIQMGIRQQQNLDKASNE